MLYASQKTKYLMTKRFTDIYVTKDNTGGPRYLRTFYLRFRLYAIKIMAVV